MPYRLNESPATFSRLMHKVPGHIPPSRLALCMDDIFVISKTFEEHLANIQEVFNAINAHGLKIKAKKCLLAMKEVTFLGHKLNRYGVKPAEQKAQAITNWPVPTSVKEVQVFVGAGLNVAVANAFFSNSSMNKLAITDDNGLPIGTPYVCS